MESTNVNFDNDFELKNSKAKEVLALLNGMTFSEASDVLQLAKITMWQHGRIDIEEVE